METESSHTATLVVSKPESAAHFWVRGDYGGDVVFTCISRKSPEHAKQAIREFARRLQEAVDG
jgi:hypothetical protein